MLGLRLSDPEQIVEEQLGGVVRGEPLQFQVGPVQDHLAQAPDFGVDTEHGLPIWVWPLGKGVACQLSHGAYRTGPH